MAFENLGKTQMNLKKRSSLLKKSKESHHFLLGTHERT